MSAPFGLSLSSLGGVLGPLLIGTLLSTVLWGITSVQIYDYFINPNEDHPWEKSIVALLCFLGTFETILNSYILYRYLVSNFSNPYALLSAAWPAACRSLIITLSTFIVRTVFAHRIYLMSKKNIPLTLWIMVISLADLVVCTVGAVESFKQLSSGNALPSLTQILYLSLALSIASDVSVTLAFFWLLYSMKTGIAKTDTLVNVIMLYFVTTGLLVVIDATLMLVFRVVMPNTLVFVGFYLLLGKLYISAYLVSLNGRQKWNKNRTNITLSLSRMSYQNRQTTGTTSDDNNPISRGSANAMAVTVQTSIERRTDDEDKKSSSVDII